MNDSRKYALIELWERGDSELLSLLADYAATDDAFPLIRRLDDLLDSEETALSQRKRENPDSDDYQEQA